MAAPLPEEYERATWRINSTDMDTLRLFHPGQVNEVVRVVLRLYCERLREGLKAQQNQALGGAAD